MDRKDAAILIEQRVAAKTEREVVLRAFGFETDPVNNKPVPPPPVPVIISARTLHMDGITAKLRTDIPGFLKRYFNFPDEEYPEPTGSVPHVVNLLEEMFIGGKWTPGENEDVQEIVNPASGKVESWAIETGPPNTLYRNGWRKDAIKEGARGADA